MKRSKVILLKGLFYLLALQTLNLSVDVDYLVGSLPRLAAIVNYDDIDSITELVVERVIGDANYTSEEDDDGGEAQNKGSEKIDYELFFVAPVVKAPLPVKAGLNTHWALGIDITNKTCKGYYNITSPPPEV